MFKMVPEFLLFNSDSPQTIKKFFCRGAKELLYGQGLNELLPKLASFHYFFLASVVFFSMSGSLSKLWAKSTHKHDSLISLKHPLS